MSSQRIELSTQRIQIYESKHKDGDLVKEHHHQIHQILYALNGDGEIFLDGQRINLTQDNGAVIVPYSTHSVVSNSKLTLLVLAFDEAALDGTVKDELLKKHYAKSMLIRLNSFVGSELRQLLRKMLFEQAQGSSLGSLAMKIYLSEMLLVLARFQAQGSTQEPTPGSSQSSARISSHSLIQVATRPLTPSPAQIPNPISFPVYDANSMRAERLRNYIDDHYYQINDSSDISSKLGVSTRHINNIFKEQYHKTPIQYLTEVRMELAKKMLQESDKDIVSICFEVGFETVSTFYRTFKNYTKISPNTYRQSSRGRTS